jgi:hypothetical protein
MLLQQGNKHITIFIYHNLFTNKIIFIMQLGGNKLNIVGSKGQWLVLSDPKTYHQYLCQELYFDSQNICEFYEGLI